MICQTFLEAMGLGNIRVHEARTWEDCGHYYFFFFVYFFFLFIYFKLDPYQNGCSKPLHKCIASTESEKVDQTYSPEMDIS